MEKLASSFKDVHFQHIIINLYQQVRLCRKMQIIANRLGYVLHPNGQWTVKFSTE